MSEHRAVGHFRNELARLEGSPVDAGRIVVLPESVHTAQLAATALGCEVGAIANSLLFAVPGPEGSDAPVLVLTSGAHRVDTKRTAERIGVPALTRARPDFVLASTGQVIGGVSPIGHPHPVPTYLDVALSAYDVVWAAAGHPAAVFSTSYDGLRKLTGATEIRVD